ncbi:uncharacterized protein LOC123037794 [Drosophila rhopaloa]|uniref:Uncharacterized protein n=1 Tax=Drosophila rhopaloa TaxID=1041015 RepID=A0ABM5JBH5_DRORH|nr:uncharacterized protein LOC123037794 [Drosophila rhopaloa]
MIPSLSPVSSWLVMLLILMQLIEVWPNCCSCPSVRCKIPQWPCCDKKSKWWNSFFG